MRLFLVLLLFLALPAYGFSADADSDTLKAADKAFQSRQFARAAELLKPLA